MGSTDKTDFSRTCARIRVIYIYTPPYLPLLKNLRKPEVHARIYGKSLKKLILTRVREQREESSKPKPAALWVVVCYSVAFCKCFLRSFFVP